MQEFPDDPQMDELFRKSAEAFEPLYDPTAWQDMAARLDRHDQTTPSVWLQRGLAVLLLLWLTGNYGWFSSSRPTQPVLAQTQSSAETSADPKASKHADSQPQVISVSQQGKQTDGGSKQSRSEAGPPAKTSNEAQSQVSVPLPRPSINQESANGMQKATPRPAPGTDPATANMSYAEISRTKRSATPEATHSGPLSLVANPAGHRASAKKPNREVAVKAINRRDSKAKNTVAFRLTNPVLASKTIKKTATPGPANAATQVTPISELTTSRLPGNGGIVVPESPENQAIALLPIRDKLVGYGRNLLTDSPAQSPVRAILPDITAQTMPVVKPIPFRRLAVGAVFSPDLSTIGLQNFDRPGINLGLSVQYQLTRRLGIQTGVLYSQKNYRALASQYVLPPTLKWGVWPSSINGDCRMIDLPINVRYDVILKKHPTGLFSSARGFVSAGVTAYWIEREAYRYNYADPNDPNIKYRSWETRTGRQGISNLNVSIGYEKQLNQRLSVQAEPFLKMPLRDIGAYKIRLISTGVFMSVRYRF